MTGILIVDDQADTRQALRRIIERQPGFRVVGEAVDGLDAVGQAGRRRPDIALMDIRMPRLDGLTATRRILARADPPAVIVLTTFGDDQNVFGARQAGASGLLLKTATVEQVAAALRTVAAGGGSWRPTSRAGSSTASPPWLRPAARTPASRRSPHASTMSCRASPAA